MTLVQIYWRGKINQLSQAARGFLASCLFSLSSPLRASLIALHGSSLRKPLAPRVDLVSQSVSQSVSWLVVNSFIHSFILVSLCVLLSTHFVLLIF